MVHEAMVLEYSGRHLAMIEWAASLKLMLYISHDRLCVRPGRHSPDDTGSPVRDLTGAVAWMAKMAVGGIALGVAEMSVAKMRVFRVPNFLGAALMLGSARRAAAVRFARHVMVTT